MLAWFGSPSFIHLSELINGSRVFFNGFFNGFVNNWAYFYIGCLFKGKALSVFVFLKLNE